MFTRHVSSLTSAYCHDELSPFDSRRVAEHLLDCERCRAEFEEVRFGARLAAHLPMVAAPESLWQGIEIALDRDDRPEPAREHWRVVRFPRSRLAIASLALCGLVFIFAVYWMRHKTGFVGSSWDVARLDGAPRIDSALVKDKAKLGVGQWLETDTNSRARIDVGEIGQVEIDPNTRVRILETNST